MMYRLDPRAARRRARIVAAVGTAQALSPAVLVIVLVHKLGYTTDTVATFGGLALLTLAVLRGVVEYGRVARTLADFAVETSDDGLKISFSRGDVEISFEDVVQALEIPGALGGIRLQLRDGRYDLPRGGATFGELRSALDAHVKVVVPPRRARRARAALVVAVVLAIFFVPFAMDDLVGHSRVAAIGVVGVVWAALFFLRRR